MADFLATKDWKSVLDLKENKTVKKTGISETLDDYASAKKKDDIGKMVSALERIVEKSNDVKTAHKDKTSITTFLTKTITAAKTEQQKLAVRLKQKDDGDEDHEDNTLGKSLVKVRALTADNAWHFVLAPGKPSSGLVISKKEIRKDSIDKAFEMKGKRGPFFIGRSYYDQGKYVFELADKPLPGLAKAAKNAAKLHAEMNIKVAIRGAGVELDGDSDIEPQEEGGGPTGTEPLLGEGRFSTYKSRAGQLVVAVGKFETSPNAKEEGAADGILGAIKVLSGQIEADTALTKDMREELLSDLHASRLRVEEANKPPTISPASKYPDLTYWSRMAEGIVRLDPSRSDDAWNKFNARLDQIKQQFKEDKALVDPDRTKVEDILKEAAKLLRQQESNTEKLYDRVEEKGNSALALRIKAMERRHDQIQKTEGLDPEQVSTVARAFTALRGTFRDGKLTDNDPRIAQVENALEKVAQLAFAKQQENSRLNGQKEMHQSLKPGMEFMKKAALPTGLIKDPAAIRELAQLLPGVRNLVESMGKASKTPGKDSGVAMEKAARELLSNPKITTDDKINKELIALASQVLARGTMMRLVEEYQGLGDPPWDVGKTDLASELQAQLFFLESAITQGNPVYEAPGLGGQSGASGSWWIERAEPKVGGKPEAKKKYIFKPAKEEATVMPGLLPGSGAPREVLAKRLDEMMSGAGFEIGVSPTTLANLDSSLLGGMEPAEGLKLGSMQQLAPSDGSLGDKLENFAEFTKTIDKKSFDDVAVFDMIYANLDRHAKNMLFATDPDTGKTKMVPIDHGSSLPDPETLQSNRASLIPGFNVMADKDMAPAQEPLGEETVEALLRLDPAKMVQDMKLARDELSNRHPETEGLMSDEAIEAMAARIHFIKAAAAAKVPVAQIFEMLAVGALRISKASAQDMPALVTTLLKEAKKAAEGRAEAAEIWPGFADVNGGIDSFVVIGALNKLGWGWAVSKTGFNDWVNDNPKLIARIMKTQQVNPAIVDEIKRLLPLALVNDPDIETKAANFNLVKRYNAYFDTAYSDMVKGPARNTPPDQLANTFRQLGGLTKLKETLRVFPSEISPLMTDPNPSDPQLVANSLVSRIAALRLWAEFEKEGGLAEVLRLGGTIRRETNVRDGLMQLLELKRSEKVSTEITDLEEDEVDEKAETVYDLGQIDLANKIDKLVNPGMLQQMELMQKKVTKTWTEGNRSAGIGALSRALLFVEDRLREEQKILDQVTSRMEEVRNEFLKLDDPIKQLLQPHMQGIYAKYQMAIDTAESRQKTNGDNEFKTRKDIATQGDESDYAKIQVALNEIRQRVNQHNTMPWISGLNTIVKKVEDDLAIFYIGNIPGTFRLFGGVLDACDMFKDALGNADLNNLPEEVTTILDKWNKDLVNFAEVQHAPEVAKKLRDLLAPAQI